MRLYKRVIIIVFILLMLPIPVYAASPAQWYQVKGSYAKEDNTQYNNGALSLMYLENDVVLFELFMAAGNEHEDTANNFCLAGAFSLNDNGVGLYENPKTGDVKITFDLNYNGVTVKQTGQLPVDVSGSYRFVKSDVKITQETAVELLEQLPTVTTSLNHNNGEYELSMSDEMIDGWFYDVKANFADTNNLLAEFYIAGDMSAVYRVDTEAPALIWGSAQPMIKATCPADSESLFGTTQDENKADANSADEAAKNAEINYVSVIPQKENIAIGSTVPTIITVPGTLHYNINFKSSNPEIVQVDEKGALTGASEGEAVITGAISIDDAEKQFQFKVSSFDAKAGTENIAPTGNLDFLWVIIPAALAALLVAFVILKKRRKQHHVDS